MFWKSNSFCHVKAYLGHHPSGTDTATTWTALCGQIQEQDFRRNRAVLANRRVGLVLLKGLGQQMKPLCKLPRMKNQRQVRKTPEDDSYIDYRLQPDSTGRIVCNNYTEQSGTLQIPFGKSGHFTLRCLCHCSDISLPLCHPRQKWGLTLPPGPWNTAEVDIIVLL